MTVKIGNQLYFAGKEDVVLVMEPEDKRDITAIGDGNKFLIIYDETRHTEQSAQEVLNSIK